MQKGLRSLGDRVIIASNRLPVILEQEENGEWHAEPGSGGLVTALAPLLRDGGGMWVGWPGTVRTEGMDLDGLLSRVTRDAGYELVPVDLTAAERDNYYYGFSNKVLWPVLHDLQTHYRFDPEYWNAYREVNQKFADVLSRHVVAGDYIWVHDYHLMGVAAALRAREVEARMGYFLHTPFPAPDIFVRLPWRYDILRFLLQYDLLGFQTLGDRRNFLECVTSLFQRTSVEGDGPVVTCRTPDRSLRVGAFPISIDFEEFAETAAEDDVLQHRRPLVERLSASSIVLGVDRLDYTKGIPNRLEGFRVALERYPELRGELTLVQVVVPSREGIPEYDELKIDIERLVGEINGRFTEAGWVPVHHIYRSLDRPELVAYYRSAAIALVTPLKDGMNLVAKEYCATNLDEDGVLILSEFAGSAAQLQDGALLVNPHDAVGVAEAIHRAFTMSREERRRRMRTLRESVRDQDIYRWVEDFASAAAGDLEGLPNLREYVPRIVPE